MTKTYGSPGKSPDRKMNNTISPSKKMNNTISPGRKMTNNTVKQKQTANVIGSPIKKTTKKVVKK